MTQPTQAQIEAARKEIASRLQASPFEDEMITEAVIAALTAAAEVRCPECKKWENRYAFAKSIYKKEVIDAIERCAQWLEDNYPTARTIAFEMRRALKDQST